MKTKKEIENIITMLNKEIERLKKSNDIQPEIKNKLIHTHLNDMAILKWVIEKEE